MAVQTQIQVRRGTAATWTSTNPTLTAGEIGFETDTGKYKIGNGATAWASLAYALNGAAVTSGTLAQFASTTSAQLAGVISDETGTGSLVFNTSPSLTTPTIGVATGTSFNSITGLSSTTPAALGTAAVGTGTTTARADHVHSNTGVGAMTGTSFNSITGLSSTTPIVDGTAAVGSLTTAAKGDHVHPTDTSRAPLASPSLTGTPLSTTAAVDTNTTQIATTAYVVGQAAASAPATIGTATVGTSLRYARQDHTHLGVTSVNGSTGAVTGIATTAGNLSQFAATTSAQLAGVVSDETGSGSLVFGTSPTITPAAATTTTATAGAGYMGLPQNTTTTGAYTVLAADAGKHIYSSATRTVTIDSNANLALPIGTTLTFISGSGATTTIGITTDTMYLAVNGGTGARTLVPFGIATAIKVAATTWIINGNGLS